MAKKTKDVEHQAPLRILIAWSPNATGHEAMEFAAWLGRTTDIEVRCVTTFLRPWPSTSISKLGGKYKKWLKKEAAACEAAVTEQLRAVGIEPEHWNEQVSVFRDGPNEAMLLTEAAEKYGADIVIMGSGAAARKGRFSASTTADSMMHSSPQALGLTPRSPKLSKRGVTRVNFAYIGDEAADTGLLRAAALAESWSLPLRILALSPGGFGAPPISESFELPRDVTLEWRENTLAVLDRSCDTVHDAYPNVTVESELGSGTGWDGALDAVKWKKGDLLCLASSPISTFERVFVGSQATEILKHITVPVLLIPSSLDPALQGSIVAQEGSE